MVSNSLQNIMLANTTAMYIVVQTHDNKNIDVYVNYMLKEKIYEMRLYPIAYKMFFYFIF